MFYVSYIGAFQLWGGFMVAEMIVQLLNLPILCN